MNRNRLKRVQWSIPGRGSWYGK